MTDPEELVWWERRSLKDSLERLERQTDMLAARTGSAQAPLPYSHGVLDTTDLAAKLPRREYDQVVPPLRRHLLLLQRACWFARVPSIVVFEGWDAAGKGETIAFLTRRLEPRGFAVHTTTPPRTHELDMPWLWRFWRRTPGYGMAAIFDRSWYRHTFGPGAPPTDSELHARCDDIVGFERTLADDGHVIMKFFLHLSEDERSRRRKKLAKDPLHAQRVRVDEWTDEGDYEAFRIGVERVMERTDSEWAPWTVASATDPRMLRRNVLATIAQRWEDALVARGEAVPERRATTDGTAAAAEYGD